MFLATVFVIISGAVSADTCAASSSCSTCTAAAGCGWCEGTAYDPTGQRSPCLPLTSNSTWRCEGQFKNKGQCYCEGTDVPSNLHYVWRGFFIDGSVKGEMVIEFFNTANQGRASVKRAGGKPSYANVTTYSGCPKDLLQISFDDGNKSACAYRLGWQSGGDAHALSLGCNANASMPTDFDAGAQLMEMYTCTDPSHCDFHTALVAPPVDTVQSVETAQASAISTDLAGACSSFTSCASCGAAAGCSWCLGRLTDEGKVLPGSGHCFGDSSQFSCSGLTLQQDCSVYKCPWFEFYTQSNCSALTGACAAPTTADDPDFNRDFPASAYLTSDKCHQSCVDPTVGCDGSTCQKTNKCDPTSTCASCQTVDLPAVMQGLEISNNFSAGLWTFNFELSTDKHVYTAVNVTSPSGAVDAYSIRQYTGTSAVFVSGAVEHGVRFDGLSNTGALGKNVYLALGGDAKVPDFGRVMYGGGSEFALLACEYDSTGNPISGQYKPINCKIGQLTA